MRNNYSLSDYCVSTLLVYPFVLLLMGIVLGATDLYKYLNNNGEMPSYGDYSLKHSELMLIENALSDAFPEKVVSVFNYTANNSVGVRVTMHILTAVYIENTEDKKESKKRTFFSRLGISFNYSRKPYEKKVHRRNCTDCIRNDEIISAENTLISKIQDILDTSSEAEFTTFQKLIAENTINILATYNSNDEKQVSGTLYENILNELSIAESLDYKYDLGSKIKSVLKSNGSGELTKQEEQFTSEIEKSLDKVGYSSLFSKFPTHNVGLLIIGLVLIPLLFSLTIVGIMLH